MTEEEFRKQSLKMERLSQRITLLLGIAPLLAVGVSVVSFYAGSHWKDWELSDRSEFTRIEMIMQNMGKPCDFIFALGTVYSHVSAEDKKSHDWMWLGQLEEGLRTQSGYKEEPHCKVNSELNANEPTD